MFVKNHRLPASENIWVDDMKERSKQLFGEMLVEDGVISKAQLEEALDVQNEQQVKNASRVDRIGVILCDKGYLDKETLEKYINHVMESYLEE